MFDPAGAGHRAHAAAHADEESAQLLRKEKAASMVHETTFAHRCGRTAPAGHLCSPCRCSAIHSSFYFCFNVLMLLITTALLVWVIVDTDHYPRHPVRATPCAARGVRAGPTGSPVAPAMQLFLGLEVFVTAGIVLEVFVEMFYQSCARYWVPMRENGDHAEIDLWPVRGSVALRAVARHDRCLCCSHGCSCYAGAPMLPLNSAAGTGSNSLSWWAAWLQCHSTCWAPPKVLTRQRVCVHAREHVHALMRGLTQARPWTACWPSRCWLRATSSTLSSCACCRCAPCRAVAGGSSLAPPVACAGDGIRSCQHLAATKRTSG